MVGHVRVAIVFDRTVDAYLLEHDSFDRRAKGQNEKEFALFSLSNATPLSSIDAERAAAQIINACRRGDAELVITIQAKLAVKLNALFPGFTSGMMALVNQLLPGNGGIGRGYATGLESTSWVSPSFVTANIDKASLENNELKPNEQII